MSIKTRTASMNRIKVFFTTMLLVSTMASANSFIAEQIPNGLLPLVSTATSAAPSYEEIPSGLCGYVGRVYSHVCFMRNSESGSPYLNISRLNCESTKPPKNCRYIDSTLDLRLVDVTSEPQFTYMGQRIVYNWEHEPRGEVIDLKIRFIDGEYEGEWISDGKSLKVFTLN